jgi:hypothetical protein
MSVVAGEVLSSSASPVTPTSVATLDHDSAAWARRHDPRQLLILNIGIFS